MNCDPIGYSSFSGNISVTFNFLGPIYKSGCKLSNCLFLSSSSSVSEDLIDIVLLKLLLSSFYSFIPGDLASITYF